ncbi:hypothetical protein [Nocardia jiangxiensis]|uniref:hypothetical protein n=1 Tax=Nocardia jiangxiensis TaxID=282685 RepID=UPI0002D783F3|nr:hypothetical protein [Nocardia jiangxiensis]
MNWLTHIIGLDNPSGYWYLFWSGLGSDITEFAVIGALLGVLRKYNCHIHGCWRIGRHPVADTTYIVCRKHHPDGAVKVSDLP